MKFIYFVHMNHEVIKMHLNAKNQSDVNTHTSYTDAITSNEKGGRKRDTMNERVCVNA